MTRGKVHSTEKGKEVSTQETGYTPNSASTDVSMSKLTIREMVQVLTEGHPFVFVIMSYNFRFEVFEKIKRVVETEENLVCLRADDVKSAGHDLLDKIHFLITRAEVVIAEISDLSPNVFYEIGYAVANDRQPLFIIEGEKKVPTDLQGKEVIRYKQTREGAQVFENDLRDHLRGRLKTTRSLFWDMLQAPDPQPAYIVASPKYPGKHSRIAGQVYDSRTFGDHLGILGLLSAFGAMWGERNGIELISAQHSPPHLLEHNYNLYLIGSEKANPHTAKLLEQVQAKSSVSWYFDSMPGFSRKDEDWPCTLYRRQKFGRKKSLNAEALIGRKRSVGPNSEEIWTEDFGLIVRSPHPLHKNRMVFILAGAHSLGTGAACLAATRSELLQKLKNALPEGILEDKGKAFWVLVKGTVSIDKDFLLDPEGVSIEEAGVY